MRAGNNEIGEAGEIVEARKPEMLNRLEPEGLLRAFWRDPPEGFVPVSLDVEGGEVRGFIAPLDLFTTSEDTVRNAYLKFKKFLPEFIPGIFTPRVLFIGTTVSEYAIFPREMNTAPLIEAAIARQRAEGLQFLIVKDIPAQTPLLRDEENRFSAELIARLADGGFLILYGQALAFVPVTFGSIDEYLDKFSRSRRKDIRRKLRSTAALDIERVNTGDAFFTDGVIDELYGLYLNVYDNSLVHFDRLTRSFFETVFRDDSGGGIVFLYRHKDETAGRHKNGPSGRRRDKIIGFNLCFVEGEFLLDKYVGFLYPDARMLNLYFVSWFHNLEFCLKNNLKNFVAGWTDPLIKSYLGASFCHTYHAVHIKNPLLSFVLGRLKFLFEADRKTLEKITKG